MPAGPYQPLPSVAEPEEGRPVMTISIPLAPEDYDKKEYVPRIKTPEHLQILAMYLAGMYQKEIAAAIGKTEQHVHNVVTCPEGQAFLKEHTSRFIERALTHTTDRIQGASAEAAQAVIGVMRNTQNERTKLVAAFDILDRAGFKAKEQTREPPVNIDSEDAKKILEALHERNQQKEALEMIQDSSAVFSGAGKRDYDYFARQKKGLPEKATTQPGDREARPPQGDGASLVDRLVHEDDGK